jgi:hypothetical protein
VFHLVTAADGAEAYYTLANNEARRETVEEARQQDVRTQRVWSGHPHHIIIDNNDKSFDEKLQQLVARISAFIGLPTLSKQAHKYVLSEVPDFDSVPGLTVQQFMIEKIMLEYDDTDDNMKRLNPGSKDPPGRLAYRFIRRRSQGSMHVRTSVRFLHHSPCHHVITV